MASQPDAAPASAPAAVPAPAHGGPVPTIERAADAPPAVDNPDADSVKDFAEWEEGLNKPAAPEDGDTGPEPAQGDKADADGPPAVDDQPGAPEPETPGVDAVALQRERDRADAAEARLRELERPKEPAPLAEGADQDLAPDPDKYDFGEADARFIADLSRWNARQEFRAQEQQRAIASELNRINTQWDAEVAKPELAEKYPDFAQVVTEGAKTGKWDCSPLMALTIKDSEVGPDVAYHLAKAPTEAARIARLSNVEQAMEMGRLEGRYLAQKQTAAASPPPVKVSTAPPPPVRSRGAGGKFAVEADTDDFAAFDKFADGVIGGKKPY